MLELAALLFVHRFLLRSFYELLWLLVPDKWISVPQGTRIYKSHLQFPVWVEGIKTIGRCLVTKRDFWWHSFPLSATKPWAWCVTPWLLWTRPKLVICININPSVMWATSFGLGGTETGSTGLEYVFQLWYFWVVISCSLVGSYQHFEDVAALVVRTYPWFEIFVANHLCISLSGTGWLHHGIFLFWKNILCLREYYISSWSFTCEYIINYKTFFHHLVKNL